MSTDNGLRPRPQFRLRRDIDIGSIAALILLFAAGISAVATVYYNVSSRQDQLQLTIAKLEGAQALILQRIDQDERIAQEKRDIDKAFSAETRASLAQISQAQADLRTLVASQGSVRH